ncbi:hypothetical protein L7F22_015117 [Adiantum nelumboides]|nr:hypothetical protein [Adiantum nelumboides]
MLFNADSASFPAFEACCRNTQVLQHLYGGSKRIVPTSSGYGCKQSKTSDQGCTVAKTVRQVVHGCELEGDSDKNKDLCRKCIAFLAMLRGNGDVRGGSEELARAGPVEEFIDPASVRGEGDKLPYFWLNDMIVVEKMRKKLHMEEYKHWDGFRIRSLDGTEPTLAEPRHLIEHL